MPGVFDRLNKEIQDKQKEGGITPLDLAGLPPALRKIMRVMLRDSYKLEAERLKALRFASGLSMTERPAFQFDAGLGLRKLAFKAYFDQSDTQVSGPAAGLSVLVLQLVQAVPLALLIFELWPVLRRGLQAGAQRPRHDHGGALSARPVPPEVAAERGVPQRQL